MIKISGLSFKYKKKPIFNNYNLVIEDKGLVLLNEKSGFGKTTLVRLINKELKPDKGSITSTFNSTSYLPQDFNLIEDKSVYENISLTGKYSDELLKYFDLEDYKNELVSSLSLGQRQIVAFIRCYIQNAEFYIFDEPTQNMDVNNTKKAMHLINGLAENHAVLLITHEEIDEDKEEVEINPVDVKRNSIETTNNKRRLFAMSLFMLIGILIGIIFPASTSYVPYVPTFPIAEENLYSIPFGREDIINSNEHDDFLLEIAEKTEIIMPRRITFSYITNVDSDSISTTPLAIGKSLVYNKTSNLKGNYDYDFEDDKFYLTKNLAKYIMKDTKIFFRNLKILF